MMRSCSRSSFFLDQSWVDGQGACFGSHDDPVVRGDAVTGRAEAVAIEGSADDLSIREGDGGGAVPGLHDGSVKFIKCFFHGVHLFVAIPCFRYQHHHHMGERATAEGQQLDDIIQAGGVGLAFRDDGQQHFHFLLGEVGRGKAFLACLQPVEITLEGIDLPVVGDEAEGLGQLPGGEGVGGKAAVYETEGRNETLVAQIGKVMSYLAAGELAFVDDRLIGEGCHVESDGVLFYRIVDGVAGVVTQQKQLPFEIVGLGYEYLFHFGLDGKGGGADAFGVDGNLTIAQDLQAQLLGGAGEDITALFF